MFNIFGRCYEPGQERQADMLHELGQMPAAVSRALPDPSDDTLVDFLLRRDGECVARDQPGDLCGWGAKKTSLDQVDSSFGGWGDGIAHK